MQREMPEKIIVIEPTKGWRSLKLHELWEFRDLFYYLAWRDIKVRYKQTFFGVAWAVLNPMAQMLIWAFLFGKIARFPSNGLPYILIALTGTLVWNYFSTIVTGCSNSVVNNANLISKIYFPRLIIPFSVILLGLVDFTVAFTVGIFIMMYYQVVPHLQLVVLPVFVLLATVSALGIGLWSSAVGVKYRDIGKLIPYLIQLCFFVTPVAYLGSVIPEKYQWVFYLNPIAGAIDGFRWSLLGMPISWDRLAISSTAALAAFVYGIFYFKRMERTFADVI